MIIKTNIAALNAHRHINSVSAGKATASRRVSSGFRINSSADDAAGLAISEKMRAQIRGLDQAFRNAQDGIALIRTAEGGIASINEMLIRMRELVVQAANDTYIHRRVYSYDRDGNQIPNSGRYIGQRTMIQTEIDQLIQEIDEISQRVQFNSRVLLSGNYARRTSNTIILPTAQQLADEVAPLLNPAEASAVMPLSSPPVPTVIIDSSNFSLGGSVPPGLWAVDPTGALIINSSSEIIKIDGTGLTGLDRIVVQPGATANVILHNVDIETSLGAAFDMRGATVDLWIAGDNSLQTWNRPRAALETTGGTVRINGSGTLSAYSPPLIPAEPNPLVWSAAIGGGANENGGTIIINGGNIQATGIGSGAAIGGGSYGDGGNITINGGIVDAIAFLGAGIGGGGASVGGSSGGSGGTGGIITINGGYVTASSSVAAGIGGGDNGDGGSITIHGGNITAAGGGSGAGIGGGHSGNGGNVRITGGRVVATANFAGAGIGGGWFARSGGTITISGGIVTAANLINGPAVGGGGFFQLTVLKGVQI